MTQKIVSPYLTLPLRSRAKAALDVREERAYLLRLRVINENARKQVAEITHAAH